MNSPYLDWRAYQEAVAAFFRQRGCTVRIEASIQGARSKHDVDVYVTFLNHGIEMRWVIECKLWKGRVKKEHVLTLKSVIEDLGAHGGILFCENDFQSGARDAARHTNILLVTSLEDYKRTVQIGENRTPLILREPDARGVPPVHTFPGGDEPQHLLCYGDRIFAGNWQTGNISVVDPTTRTIEAVVALDDYEAGANSPQVARKISRYPPGNMACADGKLFVGQVFSEFVLALDIATKAIVKRIAVPGGGDGAISTSSDGRTVYFASNRDNRLFVIDSATYEYEDVPFPEGGRGCLCVLRHPWLPLLYLGIQRGGSSGGRSYSGGNCFLATYDLEQRRYVSELYLAEVEHEHSDDAIPYCLTFDEDDRCLYVGMFQSRRGICRVDELGREILANYRFTPSLHNIHFQWVDAISQALHHDSLLSINRNNYELVTLAKRTGLIQNTTFLGEAPNGPKAVVVFGDEAVVSYPARQGLIFCDLTRRNA